MNGESRVNYAEVNGFEMYYEIHGTGEPLVALHGAYMTIGTMGPAVPALAQTRQVIAVELQGHGHTADIERPLSYEQTADDVAALLRHLGIGEADVFGYSMGGGVALQLAMRHPGWRMASWWSPQPPTPATACTPRSSPSSRPSPPRPSRARPFWRIMPALPQTRTTFPRW